MNVVSDWLCANMAIVVFIHGLAYFAMGLAIALEARRPSKLSFVGGLWLLASFAFLQAWAQWLEMFVLIRRQVAPTSDLAMAETVAVLLFPLSALFLVEFGIKSIIGATSSRSWLRWAPRALVSLWLLAIIQAAYSLCGLGTGWLWAADAWARYTLFVPGCLLSAVAFVLHSRAFREMGLTRIVWYCRGAAVAFGATAVFSGVIVAPDPCRQLLTLNESTFLAAVGLPVHIFRTASAVSIASFVVSILQVFEIEQNRQVEAATRQRFLMQQEALESQRREREAVERWSAQLEDVVSHIAMGIDRHSNLAEMLGITLRKVLELTGIEMGWVHLLSEGSGEMVLCTHRGLSSRLAEELNRLELDGEVTSKLFASGEPVITENAAEDPLLGRGVMREEGLRFHASVPLKSRGKFLGIMSLASRSERRLADQQVTLLAAIGQEVGLAIESARLAEQAQQVAVLEERERLARELHDGLAQVVGYLLMQSRAVAKLLDGGEAERAKSELEEMQQVAAEAYGDVRETILGLRTAVSCSDDLIQALEEYLGSYSHQSGIGARLVLGEGTSLVLSPSAEIQLLRIIQEALANVRRHAHAKHAWVRIEASGDKATITIEDDGRGFDLMRQDCGGLPRFGLQTMKERAESVGGTLEIVTQPGHGTRVIVVLPMGRRQGRF